ncbi:unnamed protein product [Parnassius apollo]|uniref:(apollo) hypothetical protein n=1 Tax=Parnassius apollo TaxID=110799 RepID=A0A8S3X5G4_PARAO|nr:unnamed protein product [Parnassius apollo]
MHTLRLLWPANNETTLQRRQTRVNRREMVQIVEMEELEFVHRFRLDKQSFWRLCDDLRRLTSLKGTREINLEIKRRFRLPGIVGCIDCTHVAIVKPPDEEHLFFNRKGYHSLNVQIVCNSNLKITDVNPKFGGATHDSLIWASSRKETFMRELHQNGEQVWLFK